MITIVFYLAVAATIAGLVLGGLWLEHRQQAAIDVAEARRRVRSTQPPGDYEADAWHTLTTRLDDPEL